MDIDRLKWPRLNENFENRVSLRCNVKKTDFRKALHGKGLKGTAG
jgi:hypothetical protein